MSSPIRYVRAAYQAWNPADEDTYSPSDYGFFLGYLLRKIRADLAARRGAAGFVGACVPTARDIRKAKKQAATNPPVHVGATVDWSPTDQHRLVGEDTTIIDRTVALKEIQPEMLEQVERRAQELAEEHRWEQEFQAARAADKARADRAFDAVFNQAAKVGNTTTDTLRQAYLDKQFRLGPCPEHRATLAADDTQAIHLADINAALALPAGTRAAA